MRRHIFLLALLSLAAVNPARAQDNDDSATYRITNVTVDVLADTAVRARDQALLQAQKAAFVELAVRLGIEGKPQPPDDETLGKLIQAFEVESEKTPPQRYIGSITIQFKPQAARAYFAKAGSAIQDIRSKPVIVLPVTFANGRPVLWEDRTPWRATWDDAQRQTGLVPLLVPQGDMDDIALIGAADAMNGKADALQAVAAKYKASGVMVAVLNEAQDPKQSARLDLTRFDVSGKTTPPVHLTLPPAADPKAVAAVLADAAKQTRDEIEKAWRSASKSMKGSATRHEAIVPIASLAEWNDIKSRLQLVTGLAKTSVSAITRETARIDLAYHGDAQMLQANLADQGLALDTAGADWILRKTTP